MKNIVRFLLLCVVVSSTCTACRNQEMSDLESGVVKQSLPSRTSMLPPASPGVIGTQVIKLKDDCPVKVKDNKIGSLVDIFRNSGLKPSITSLDESAWLEGFQPYDSWIDQFPLQEVMFAGVPRLSGNELSYQPDQTYGDRYYPNETLLYSDLPNITEIAIWFDSQDRSSSSGHDHKKVIIKFKQDSLAKVKKSKVIKN